MQAKRTLILYANRNLAVGIALCLISAMICKSGLALRVTRHLSTTYDPATNIPHQPRLYPPALYPQVTDIRNFTHDSTWYAVSAYVDIRPLAYGDSPAITIIAGGPIKDVTSGTTWHARLFILHTGAFITLLQCEPTRYAPLNQRASIHASADVICKMASKWNSLQSLTDELGVCIVRSPQAFCDVASIVPVGVPPRYPNYPYSWADSYLCANATSGCKHGEVDAEKQYFAGNGRISLCVPGVRGDRYARTLRFFLEFYMQLGVDTAHIYMHSPGHEFARIAETIVAEQASGTSTHLARLILLPWCMQLGASYRCGQGPTIPLPEADGFVGQYFGQLLAHQDCLYRSMGTFRWAVFVDLDEYIFPRRPNLRNLRALVRDDALSHDGVAAAELSIHMALYESCMPSPTDHNVIIPPSPAIEIHTLKHLPRPAWSAARVSNARSREWFPKFICDPMRCDRMAIHRAHSYFCERYPGRKPEWDIECNKRHYVPEELAIIHHTRAFARNRQALFPSCAEVDGVHEVDWSFTNFVVTSLASIKSKV